MQNPIGNSMVPIIDISAINTNQLSALDMACRNHGFFLITGHGLNTLIDKTFSVSREFFATDYANKQRISRDLENPMGWYDRELTKGKRDHKEIFDFTAPNAQLGIARNKWPDKPAEFKETLTEFHNAFSTLAAKTTMLVFSALGLSENTATPYHGDPAISPVRLNNYLTMDPVPQNQRDQLAPLGTVALGEHTDPGILTLLLQDNVGGLQTKVANRDWVNIIPTPGSVVVNLGDTMQVRTNDIYRAALHRVQPVTKMDRMSIPYFLHPPRNATIEPIPEISNGTPYYRPYTWLEYIAARDTDNFDDIGKADAQISDYRIDLS